MNSGSAANTFVTLLWKPIPGYHQDDSTCDSLSDNSPWPLSDEEKWISIIFTFKGFTLILHIFKSYKYSSFIVLYLKPNGCGEQSSRLSLRCPISYLLSTIRALRHFLDQITLMMIDFWSLSWSSLRYRRSNYLNDHVDYMMGDTTSLRSWTHLIWVLLS